MSSYVTARRTAVDAFTSANEVSHVHAQELARDWEYEANRRGLDFRRPDFWALGEAWMTEHLAPSQPEPAKP